mmetsp:Transcript_20964/g.52003  ORF Transcript_20964/g.52003 Transcript_20964/m.52003 type:complete len:285 (+) Transcript_20964:398-1252(+)
MLRGNIVRNRNALVDVLALDSKGLFESFKSCAAVGFWQGVHLLCDFDIDFLDQFVACAKEYGPGNNVVFRLGNEVSSHNCRTRCLVTDHQHLGWARQHVNSTLAADYALGGRNPHVSGPTNNVTRGDFRITRRNLHPECHGCDRLGTAHSQKEIGTCHVSRCKGDRCGLGARQDNRGTSGGSSSDGRHQHTRREGIASSGGVTSGSSTGADSVTGFASGNVHFGVFNAAPLHVCERLDTKVHVVQCFLFGRIQTLVCFFARISRDNKIFDSAAGVDITQALGYF